MGRIQMIECLKILLVLFLDMGDGEEVDGYSCVAYRSGSTDTCAGDVVGVGCQSFLVEDVIAGFYYALIVYIYISHVDPCSYQVSLHGHLSICLIILSILLLQDPLILIKYHSGLLVRVLALCFFLGESDAMKEDRFLVVCGLDEEAYLAAVEWSLFHDCVVGIFQKLLKEKGFLEILYLVFGVA